MYVTIRIYKSDKLGYVAAEDMCVKGSQIHFIFGQRLICKNKRF